MRDVSLKVMVVLAVMFACIAPGHGAAGKKTRSTSAFDQLSDSQLIETLIQLGMHEFVDAMPTTDSSPTGILLRARIDAAAMRQITDPAARLAKGRKIIAVLEKAVNLALKEKDDAEKNAEKATPQTRIDKRLAAAKAAYLYFDILYFLGDLSGRQAIEPYALKLMDFQDNREDRRIILEMTENAVLDLGDMQDELKNKLQDWQDQMSVWMIKGSQGEILLRKAQYWSTWSYLYRAMALGDAEAHQTDRDQLRGAFGKKIADLPADQAASKKKLEDQLAKELAALTALQKKRTILRRQLLGQILMLLPKFEKTKRFGVTHEARRLMALAHRELGEYSKAMAELAGPRYQGARKLLQLVVSKELPLALVKDGSYAKATEAISKFKGYAELVVGRGKPLSEDQQGSVDLDVAVLNDYLFRRWAATSTSPADKSKCLALGQAAMVGFLDKYKTDSRIGRAFINKFGNRLLYAENIEQLSSVQLYIIASGAAARKEPERRRVMLETILSREKDPAAKKLAAPAHWQLAMVMNQLTRNIDAANHFISVVTLLGADNPRAPRAAKNAAICMTKYVAWFETNKTGRIPRSVRLKCAEALKHAVSFEAKYPELKLSEWYFSLGVHCDKLSQNSPAKEVVVWMQRAAEAFGKVPSEPRGKYVEAQDLRLDLSYRALTRGEVDAKSRATARSMREQYVKFIELVEKFIASLPDKTSDDAKAQISVLTERAAWADFRRAKLLSEQLGKEIVALVEVDTLLKKWSMVNSVVEAGNQWKIQNLVDQKKIVEASAALAVLLKENPDVGAGLIEQVIGGIQKAIAQARASGDKAKLASLRKSYLQFAKMLYAPVEGKPIEIKGEVDSKRLSLTRLWIDALIENDKGTDAMKLASECRRIFNKKRDAQTKIINGRYDEDIRKCKAAVGMLDQMEKRVKIFKDELLKRSRDPGFNDFNPAVDAAPVDMALKTLKSLPADAPPEKRTRLMQNLSREIRTGYRDIIRRLKNRIPVDLKVEWNVAKCLAATGKYAESLKIYVRLINGTDPLVDRNTKLRFWRLQLEYVQTFFAGYNKDKKEMGKLLNYIQKELKRRGGDSLGGFKVDFYRIQEEARNLSE
ncbi:MAG: hypothetical protein QGH60_19075 [Phycisphaerae bacterium]|jgi:hypothetical protein|nr:hypothetical protein [Phycisphaerae bacterium]